MLNAFGTNASGYKQSFKKMSDIANLIGKDIEYKKE